MILRQEDEGGQVMVMMDEERVWPGAEQQKGGPLSTSQYVKLNKGYMLVSINVPRSVIKDNI